MAESLKYTFNRLLGYCPKCKGRWEEGFTDTGQLCYVEYHFPECADKKEVVNAPAGEKKDV